MRTPMNRRRILATGVAGAALAALPLAAQQTGKLYEIEIKDFKFNPATLEVQPGDRIRWTNRDGAPHDATALDGRWNTKRLRTNKSGELTMEAGMSADYYCSIHPSMRASITVKA